MYILNIYRLDFVWYLIACLISSSHLKSDQIGTFSIVTRIWLTFPHLWKNYRAFSTALQYFPWYSYGNAHETQEQTEESPNALNVYQIS